MDIGSSTGGFTDVLLSRGAMHVVAVDSGTNQLAWKLRQDHRVTVLEKASAAKLNYYVMEFSNPGGLVMPIILRLHYRDGEAEDLYLPAEIWRRNATQVNKLIARTGELTGVEVDPHRETADVELSNNHYPRRILPSRLEIYEEPDPPTPIPERDLMQEIKTPLQTDDVDSASG